MRVRLFLILPLCVTVALAQGSSGGLANLRLPSHARSAALGGVTVGDPNAISDFTANPALLNYAQNTEFVLSHQNWIEDIRTEGFSAILPLSIGVLGVSVSATSIDGIQLREQPGPADGTFSSRYSVIGLSGAASIDRDLHAGLTLKYLYEKIFVDEADGWGLDLGLAYRTGIHGLSLGTSLQNIGSMSPLHTVATELPLRFTAGVSFENQLEEKTGMNLEASLVDEIVVSVVHVSLGVEIGYANLLSLRAGYQTGYSVRGISAGIGLASLPILVDYSFIPFSYSLGSAHLLTIGIRLSHEP